MTTSLRALQWCLLLHTRLAAYTAAMVGRRCGNQCMDAVGWTYIVCDWLQSFGSPLEQKKKNQRLKNVKDKMWSTDTLCHMDDRCAGMPVGSCWFGELRVTKCSKRDRMQMLLLFKVKEKDKKENWRERRRWKNSWEKYIYMRCGKRRVATVANQR